MNKEDEINLTLTIPPSVNQTYSTNFKTKRRFKSKKYKEWTELALTELLSQKRYIISSNEWLGVRYVYFMPLFFNNGNKKKIDVFNYEKALSDFLEDHIEGFKDENIKKGIVEKIDSDRWEVEIVIKESLEDS